MQDQEQGESERISEFQEETTCCIVGAGPAGVVLALLLARQGVAVTLLEEHGDFARDFRGDTVHPATMEILAQLGLVEKLLELPHSQVPILRFKTQQGVGASIDLRHLKTPFPYITLLPQVLFLELLTEEASKYPSFRLLMGARAERLIEEDGQIHGVHYRAQDGWHELRAVLTVGTDGRFSRIRKLAGFEPIKSSPPMDVLWFRVPHLEGQPEESSFMLGKGHLVIQLERGDMWQIGYVIAKGGYQKIKAAGLEHLRADVGELLPWLKESMPALTEWRQVSVLSVESSRVPRWYRPGLLVIGDAAHVMSPVAGVGINYAIQDAVATANLLTRDLQAGKAPIEKLARIQRRREWPTRIIQALQSLIQKQLLEHVLKNEQAISMPRAMRIVIKMPILHNLPPRLIGFGPRPERVKYVEVKVPARAGSTQPDRQSLPESVTER